MRKRGKSSKLLGVKSNLSKPSYNQNVHKKPEQTASATQPLIEGRVDALLGGGLSLAIAIVVIIWGSFSETKMNTALGFIVAYLFTDLLINSPHFMASYRILYSNKRNIRRHPFVTLVLPVCAISLLAYVCYWGPLNTTSDLKAGVPQPSVMLALTYLAPIFLGWHYVGQSWGTTACFAYLAGFRMNPSQRKLIRFGFLSLFAYHLTWACASMEILEQLFPQQRAGEFMIKAVMSVCRVLVLASFFAGLWGFFQISQEHKRRIPATVWLPWVATYSWYVMVDVYPKSFFLLQIFHALQYLMFPARVEINQHHTKHVPKHMLIYYVALVLVGYLAFDWTKLLEGIDLANQTGTMVLLGAATMMCINIHHYFIDAVIWKIREPEVRESLFGHLET
ncbi:hypothetical protein N9102_00755 [bacterium]|nr:hypothetical protein [bacterium]